MVNLKIEFKDVLCFIICEEINILIVEDFSIQIGVKIGLQEEIDFFLDLQRVEVITESEVEFKYFVLTEEVSYFNVESQVKVMDIITVIDAVVLIVVFSEKQDEMLKLLEENEKFFDSGIQEGGMVEIQEVESCLSKGDGFVICTFLVDIIVEEGDIVKFILFIINVKEVNWYFESKLVFLDEKFKCL